MAKYHAHQSFFHTQPTNVLTIFFDGDQRYNAVKIDRVRQRATTTVRRTSYSHAGGRRANGISVRYRTDQRLMDTNTPEYYRREKKNGQNIRGQRLPTIIKRQTTGRRCVVKPLGGSIMRLLSAGRHRAQTIRHFESPFRRARTAMHCPPTSEPLLCLRDRILFGKFTCFQLLLCFYKTFDASNEQTDMNYRQFFSDIITITLPFIIIDIKNKLFL